MAVDSDKDNRPPQSPLLAEEEEEEQEDDDEAAPFVPKRGSQVTTMAEFRLCGAIVAGGFGNPLLTGRQTHANITDAVPATTTTTDTHCVSLQDDVNDHSAAAVSNGAFRFTRITMSVRITM